MNQSSAYQEVLTGSLAEWAMVIVTGLSAGLILLQLHTSHKELRDDHERSRRETAVNLLQEWTKGMRFESSAILGFVKTLSQEQCDQIVKRQPLCLDDNTANRDLIKSCLDFKWPEFDIDTITCKEKITIAGAYEGFLRFMTVYYLNFLESTLAAWNAGVATPRIIEDQFKHLLATRSDLPKFRNSMKDYQGGIDPYPSISNFMVKVSPPVRKPEEPVDRRT